MAMAEIRIGQSICTVLCCDLESVCMLHWILDIYSELSTKLARIELMAAFEDRLLPYTTDFKLNGVALLSCYLQLIGHKDSILFHIADLYIETNNHLPHIQRQPWAPTTLNETTKTKTHNIQTSSHLLTTAPYPLSKSQACSGGV